MTRSITNNNAPVIGQQFLSRHIPEKLLLESGFPLGRLYFDEIVVYSHRKVCCAQIYI